MPNSVCPGASKTLLVVLQCAYGNTEERRRQLEDRTLWLYGLWHSHTGRRLKEMIPAGYKVVPINASPKIGKQPDAKFAPDLIHIKMWITWTRPDVILGCGNVAQEALNEIDVQYISAPHPAWRQLSKADTREIREKLGQLR